jgi:hypothetical protein
VLSHLPRLLKPLPVLQLLPQAQQAQLHLLLPAVWAHQRLLQLLS